MESLVSGGRPFHRRQAGRHGFTPYQLACAVATGVLRRPLRAVYVDARVSDTRDLRVECLALVLPPRAVVWGKTAAWVWGVDSFGPDERTLLDPECAVPHHRGRPTYDAVRTVEQTLPAGDIVELAGFRVTTPRRTALDLARFLRRPMALAALDAFTHAGLVTLAELVVGLGAFYRHPGVRQARELVSYADPRVESPGESWLRLRIIDAGFPRPEPQVRLYDRDGRERFRLDLGYRSRRIGLEYDGELYHSGVDREAYDERRRKEIERDFGWSVWGFRRGEVLGWYPAVELAVGELLSQEPRLPRRW
jgi:hypothetical protein